ncbi:hypothetical protein BDV10DRAFT_118322 [Aspergillus recurvatus]
MTPFSFYTQFDTISFLRDLVKSKAARSSGLLLVLELRSHDNHDFRSSLSANAPCFRSSSSPSISILLSLHILWIWAFHLADVTHRSIHFPIINNHSPFTRRCTLVFLFASCIAAFLRFG